MTTSQRIYAMLGNESLWEVAARCHDLFQRSNIAYSICGGVAVCLHGYQRNTVNVDLIIAQTDSDVVELIIVRNHDGSFSRHLHSSIRGTFRELVKNARSEG